MVVCVFGGKLVTQVVLICLATIFSFRLGYNPTLAHVPLLQIMN